ncbi:hypothetical protein [Rhodoblastus sp.]|uniref:hypothetical protein n=1 Tax=Rhodoblastus sp. TaxID=1962975 RepID=UPI003F94DA75
MYSSSDNYWSGAPGIYGSARGALVSAPASDVAYQAWLTSHFQPTPWPKDATGAVTTAALDAVLIAAGLAPTGLTAPTAAALKAYAWSKAQALFAAERAYPMTGMTSAAGATAIQCAVASSQPNLNSLAFWAAGVPDSSPEIWTDDAYQVWTLTQVEALAFTAAVIGYGKSVYAILGVAADGINGGSITTMTAIDMLGWPT